MSKAAYTYGQKPFLGMTLLIEHYKRQEEYRCCYRTLTTQGESCLFAAARVNRPAMVGRLRDARSFYE